jgi:tetratricopeptide (TPR) repeat protein
MKKHLISFIFVLLFLAPASSFSLTGIDEMALFDMDLGQLELQAAQLKARLEKDSSNYETTVGLGVVRFFMAVKNPKDFSATSVQLLEQALQAKPEDDEVRCYLGSAYLLRAASEPDQAIQASYVGKGLEYMDAAVKNRPDSISTRMVRGNTAMALPDFLNRRATAYQDFEYITDVFKTEIRLSPRLKASVYGSLSILYEKDGDAEKAREYRTLAEKLGN